MRHLLWIPMGLVGLLLMSSLAGMVSSAAAGGLSVLALLQENTVAQEVKYLTDQVAGLKEEIVELRKAEERADHVIVVPGKARE